ncbi:MAG: hypothetical protein Q9227_009335 [Pyrenula ochraceoflavens]
MVGVPRSKGCRTCVKARVKCDQTRPSCLRCNRKGIPCPGYGPLFKFQDEGPKLEGQYRVKSSTSGPEGPSSSTRRTPPTKESFSRSPSLDTDELQALENLLVSVKDPPKDQSNLTPVVTTSGDIATRPFKTPPDEDPGHSYAPLLDAILSPATMQAQLLAIYLQSTQPGPSLSTSPLRGLQVQAEWLKQLFDQDLSSRLLSYAIRACTLSHLGRAFNSEPLLRVSRTFYQYALQYLRKTLDPTHDGGESGRSSTTLAATIFLSNYETFTCTTSTSFVKHAGGAGALMRIRGPAAHRHGFDKAMFLAFRNLLIVHACEANIPCFLNEPEWRQLAIDIFNDDVQRHTAPGRCMEEFYLSVLNFPDLCADAQRLLDSPPSDNEEYRTSLYNLATRVHQIRLENYQVWSKFSQCMSESDQWVTLKPSPDPTDSVFPIIFDFSDIFVASIVCWYNCFAQGINVILQELNTESTTKFEESLLTPPDAPPVVVVPTLTSSSNDDPFTSFTGISRGEVQLETEQFARAACMCVSYLSKSNYIGPLILTYALRMALRTLNYQPEVGWIRRQQAELGKKMGIATRKTSWDLHYSSSGDPKTPAILRRIP